MPITITDVARRAQVSTTTVSRVLNAKGEVDSRTAERVRRVIAELGYVPSSRAVALASGRTRTLGLLVPPNDWSWMGDVLQGALDALQEVGFGLLVHALGPGEREHQRFLTRMAANTIEGLLVVVPDTGFDFLVELQRRGTPIVLVDDRGYRSELTTVTTTNEQGGYDAAQHLVSSGRSRPAVLTGPTGFGCTVDRLAGTRRALADAGLPLDPDLVRECDFSEGDGRRATADLLASGARFDSVIAQNDDLAVGAIRAARAAGRSVPTDLAVIGFDDAHHATWTDPQLTTVRQPLHEMGRAGARLLLDHVGGGTPLPADPIAVPTELIRRDSA